MLIMLTPDQVPRYWEAIKYAAVKADRIEEGYLQSYANRLLYMLLSNKAQCFFRINQERRLQAVLITRFYTDEIRNKKSLFLNCLYSFERVPPETWAEDMEVIKKFARKNNCSCLTSWAISERAAEVNRLAGLKDQFKSFILELEGDN